MKDSLRQQFERLALRLTELEATLADPSVAADMQRFRALNREYSEVEGVVSLFRQYEACELDASSARAILERSDDDPEMAELARDEVIAAETEAERLHQALQAALLPRDPDDVRNAFIEVRAGTGGEESALFAADIARMYLRHAERQGWRTEVMSESVSDLGGFLRERGIVGDAP